MQVKFWGESALFCRPEYKAEPHTYPALTPTAAEGMLKAIFWKPEIRYEIERIVALNPVRTMAMVRNTVQDKATPSTVRQWARKGGHYFADSDRAQRNHVLLKDPAYIVHFHLELAPHADGNADKYVAQLKRRIGRGQCFRQPYFGCREYPAFFGWPQGDETVHPELLGERDLGMMPKKLHFIPSEDGPISWRDAATRQTVSGRMEPEFFRARMHDGAIEVN